MWRNVKRRNVIFWKELNCFTPGTTKVLYCQLYAMLYLPQDAEVDPRFPRGGGAKSRGGPTYDFAKFSQKLHEIEKIWTRGGAFPKFYSVDPPLVWIFWCFSPPPCTLRSEAFINLSLIKLNMLCQQKVCPNLGVVIIYLNTSFRVCLQGMMVNNETAQST